MTLAFLTPALQWCAARPAQIFAIIAAFFGTIFCLILPPLNGSDEFTHFPRAYSIASGQLSAQRVSANQYGDFLPVDVVRMVDDYRDLSRKATTQEYRKQTQVRNHYYWTHRNDTPSETFTPFSSSAPYSPWSFTPGVAGIAVAQLLDVPLLAYVYIGRFFTLTAWIALTYAAIRLLPAGKWFLVAIALLPTSVLQAATIGPDALINGVSWLLIAASLAFFARTLPVNAGTLFGTFILSLILCTTKQGYWLLAALPFFIPTKILPSTLRLTWRLITPVVLIAISLIYAWSTQTILQDGNLLQRELPVNSHEQLSGLLAQPLHYAWVLIAQPFASSYNVVYEGLVGIFGNRQIHLPLLVSGGLYLALLIALVASQPISLLRQHKNTLRILAATIFIGTYTLISTALYLSFTPVGSNAVEGMQGRYFLPLLPLALIFALTVKKPISLPRAVNVGAACVIILALCYTCFVITT